MAAAVVTLWCGWIGVKPSSTRVDKREVLSVFPCRIDSDAVTEHLRQADRWTGRQGAWALVTQS